MNYKPKTGFALNINYKSKPRSPFKMSQAEINQSISEIIEHGKSGKLYVLPVALKQVVLVFRPYIGLFNKINKIIKSSTQLTTALAILTPELLEYLLEFVILFFEKGCNAIFQMESHFTPKKGHTDSIIRTIFDFLYRNYIDMNKSDDHVLAYLYLSYLSNTSDFGYMLSANYKENISRNSIKTNFVENYILKSDNARQLSMFCKKSLFRIIAVNYNSDTILPENLILSKFCSNNDKKLKIMEFKKTTPLLRVQNEKGLHKKINSDDVSLVIGSYLYKTLNIFQALLCLNSTCFNSKLVSSNGVLKLLLRTRISEWITKYPDIIDYINSEISFYWYAFLNICYFWNNIKGDSLSRYFGRLFCKANLEYILSEVCKPKNSFCDVMSDSFETWMKAFPIFKVIDDEFVLLLLYSKAYSKRYSYASGVGHLRSARHSKQLKPIWYIINDVNNLNSDERGYNVGSSGLHIKIHGINNGTVVRRQLCIDHFASTFGIDQHHLDRMEKILVEKPKTCNQNRKHFDAGSLSEISTFRKLQTLHNRIKLKRKTEARMYYLPMMNSGSV